MSASGEREAAGLGPVPKEWGTGGQGWLQSKAACTHPSVVAPAPLAQLDLRALQAGPGARCCSGLAQHPRLGVGEGAGHNGAKFEQVTLQPSVLGKMGRRGAGSWLLEGGVRAGQPCETRPTPRHPAGPTRRGRPWCPQPRPHSQQHGPRELAPEPPQRSRCFPARRRTPKGSARMRTKMAAAVLRGLCRARPALLPARTPQGILHRAAAGAAPSSEFRSEYALDRLYPEQNRSDAAEGTQDGTRQTSPDIPMVVDLAVGLSTSVFIFLDCLSISYCRSSGPGGQNVNKAQE
ncbi:peptidyl-tRNA hydrolase ICT1, mitochondrial isoform X4 [Gopherus evgoodei]|uniref:peptidyl-tRNA hydrolase ICT1, mitochondrial isoform X4 n=1 Tax=Gopherus evgoodei TaxID=1825980 RepID=UPI0011CFD0C6|nr:peptidyl-tRNA hydrolase ICT1, mitochondrial isoform X4 [Gopherus evgoodei]